MEKNRKNIIPVIILLSVYTISLYFDNRILNVNTIHLFLFSMVALFLCVSMYFFEINFFGLMHLRVFFISFALFIMFLFISSNINDRFVLAIEDILLYFTIFIFSYLVFISFQIYETEKLMNYIAMAVSVICGLVALLGILEFFNINILNFQQNSRPGSTLSIRNFASEYSVIALPYLMILGLNKEKRSIRIYSVVTALIILVFIFFCRTRSSFVALFIYFTAITIYFVYNRFFIERDLKKIYLTIIALLAVSFLIGTYSAPNLDKERSNLNTTISSMFDYRVPENESRMSYWKTSLRIFRDMPFTGIGAGSWFGIFPKYNGNIYTDDNVLKTSELNPHNDYLEILSENGLIGFLFYFLFLLLIGKYLVDETRKKLINFPVLLSYLGFLAIALISFPKNNISVTVLFATSIGIALKGKEQESRNDELLRMNLKKVKLSIFSILSVTLLIIMAFCMLRYRYEKVYMSAIEDKFNLRYEKMIEKIDEINDIIYPVDPNKMPIEYYKGVGYYELKNYPAALNSFNNALELTPFVPAILSNKASCLYMMKDNDEAIKLLFGIKRRFPLLMEAQINLVAIYANTGQDSVAKLLIEDIDRFAPDSTSIKNFNVLKMIKEYYNEKNPH